MDDSLRLPQPSLNTPLDLGNSLRNFNKTSFLRDFYQDANLPRDQHFQDSIGIRNSSLFSRVSSSHGEADLRLDKAQIDQIKSSTGRDPIEVMEFDSNAGSDADEADLGEDGVRQLTEMKREEFNQMLLYQLNNYLPDNLINELIERRIPLYYVRGLLCKKQQHEIKSVRRLKVERYLEKRRTKTWDRKICYNCRQKVAEERLRIKGKFIKKRRAMEILGLKNPVSLAELKVKLEAMLKDKSNEEIDCIIKVE